MSMDDLRNARGFERNQPEHVGALAERVISTLRDRQDGASDGVRQFVLEYLMRALLARDMFVAHDVYEDMRAHRVTADTIVDVYIVHAARQLGDKWINDEITFSQVTIGTLRLQSLLTEIAPPNRMMHFGHRQRLHTLIIVPQGEQHFLGANVVAAQLRRTGCEVTMSFDETHERLRGRVKFDAPHLALITCSGVGNLESVARTVDILRSEPNDGPTIALGGAVTASEEDLKEATGVDIVTSSAAAAVAFCTEGAKVLARK